MSPDEPKLVKDLAELVILNKQLHKEEIKRSVYSLVHDKEYEDSFSHFVGLSLRFKFHFRKPLKHDLVQTLLKLVEDIGGKNSIVYLNMNCFDDDEL